MFFCLWFKGEMNFWSSVYGYINVSLVSQDRIYYTHQVWLSWHSVNQSYFGCLCCRGMPPGVTVMNQSLQVSFLLVMLSMLLNYYLSKLWTWLIPAHEFIYQRLFGSKLDRIRFLNNQIVQKKLFLLSLGCSHCEGHHGVRFRRRGEWGRSGGGSGPETVFA